MAQNLDLTGYHLTFDDEFNSFKTFDGHSGWDMADFWGNRTLPNNAEQQLYVDPSYAGSSGHALGLNPFSIDNGVLTITATPTDPALKSVLGNASYISGDISTAHSFSQQYGYFEMRAQLPDGQGLWPAFWMLPANGQWPPELDVVEKVDNDPAVVQTTHWSGGMDGTKYFGINPSDGMHSYGMMWQPDGITYYVDGIETAHKANVSNQPMYLQADLAVGGYWPGSPDGSTHFPAQMKIDYIHAWSQDPNAAAVAPAPEAVQTDTTHTGTTPPDTSTAPDPAPAATDSGQGKDTITVHVSEDAYQGDAHFKLLVDGNQIGAETPVTASHAAGQWQDITFHTDLPADARTIGVQFTNDAWGGGSPDADRNLHVGSVSVDGHTLTPADGYLTTSGATATMNLTGATTATAADTATTATAVAGDTFHFDSLPAAPQTIDDYVATTDHIDLHGLLNSIGYHGTDPVHDHVVTLTAQNGSTLLGIDQNPLGLDHHTDVALVQHIQPTVLETTLLV